MTETMVCEACTMKIPTEVHALSHLITHGRGHEPHRVTLDEQGRKVA